MNEAVEVILQHGWAWTSACWSGWREVAPEGFVLRPLDRGYFGRPMPWSGGGAGPRIVVAHSLGLHLLSPEVFGGAELLVICGGFQTFHPAAGPASRRSRRVVQQMQQGLVREPGALLRDFYAQCFFPDAAPSAVPEGAAIGRLALDLELLYTSALDLRTVAPVPRVLLLHGREDRIVPLARAEHLHRQLRHSSLRVVAGAGHALPFTHVRACWEMILQRWSEKGESGD